jgi:hypothetical protein
VSLAQTDFLGWGCLVAAESRSPLSALSRVPAYVSGRATMLHQDLGWPRKRYIISKRLSLTIPVMLTTSHQPLDSSLLRAFCLLLRIDLVFRALHVQFNILGCDGSWYHSFLNLEGLVPSISTPTTFPSLDCTHCASNHEARQNMHA